MNQLRSRARLRLLASALALLSAVVVASGCMPSASPTPLSTSAPAPASQPPTSAPAAPPASSKASLPSGVDADGNFYRGDPNAPVKLVEYSDFQ